MKKLISLLFLTSSMLLVSACNLMPGKNTETSSNPATSSTDSSSDSNSGVEPPLTGECFFETSGTSLPFSNYGIHIGDNNSEIANRDLFKNKCNEQAGSAIISSLSASNCTILTDDGSSSKEHLHLTIGTGSSNGYIQFTFARSIKKITISVIAYYKSTFSLDKNALVSIDGENHQIPNVEGAEKQDAHEFSKEYSEGTSKIKLSNKDEDQRFFLESVKVQF